MGTYLIPRASLFGLFVALGLAGCGHQSGNNDDSGPKAPIGNIKIDSNIKTLHRNYLAESVDYFDSLTSAWGDQPALSKLTGLQNISAESLHQWLEDRVQYILGSSFDPRHAGEGFYSDQPFNYEKPGVLPFVDSETASNAIGASDTKFITLMQNFGASYYYVGKKAGKLVGLNIPGVGPVLLTSPRTGVVQLGAHLFPEGPLPPSHYNYILLVATLFHEAHHSDGNGTSLGFFHAVCPEGHQYAGHLACDRTLNGPYQLGADLEKTLIGNCTQCTVKESEMLSGLVADNLSRVLPTSIVDGKTVNSTNWDSAPEGHR